MIMAARPRLWNTFLHAPTAPAVTQRQLIEAFAAAARRPDTEAVGASRPGC